MVKIIYNNKDIVVCIKPSGALSTDEPGGMPEMLRLQLGNDTEIKSVHRLDRVVSGLMVYAKNTKAAADISRQMTDDAFSKSYLAVIHGVPEHKQGRLDDLLFRDKSKNMTYVVKRMRKGVRDASLEYEVLDTCNDLSLVKIHLITGRTHQIRAQFSSRQMILVGDKKYGAASDNCQIALWSYKLLFKDPCSNVQLNFEELPPSIYPWNLFNGWSINRCEDEYELAERKAFRTSSLNSN